MNKEKLYEVLDITDSNDFEYFETFASFMECGEDIDDQVLYEIFKDVNIDSFTDVIHNYFEDIVNSTPGEEGELISIFDNECKALIGLLRSNEENSNNLFVDELQKFRAFYSIEESVIVKDLNEDYLVDMTICDALFTIRGEKFDGSKHEYNFNNCLNYTIDEYVMSLGDMLELELEEEE